LALLALAVLDIGLTKIGVTLGVTEMNPVVTGLRHGVFELRMATVALFTGLFALLYEKFPWACTRALWIVLIIMSFVVVWNLIQIGDGIG
jgi:hypothetical protein